MEDRLHTRVGAVVLVLLVIGVGLALLLANRHLRPGFVIHVEFARTGGCILYSRANTPSR